VLETFIHVVYLRNYVFFFFVFHACETLPLILREDKKVGAVGSKVLISSTWA